MLKIKCFMALSYFCQVFCGSEHSIALAVHMARVIGIGLFESLSAGCRYSIAVQVHM